MILFGDGAHDARVQREAATLAAAGHDVRLAVTPSTSPGGGSRGADPFTLRGVTVAVVAGPSALPLAVEWIWRPWRLRRRAAGRIRAGSRRGPGGWPMVAVVVVSMVGSLPWLVVRGGLHVLARRIGWTGAGVDWLLWWRWIVGAWGARVGRAIGPVDVWHGHDLPGLVAAARAAGETGGSAGRGAVLVYDSHEIYLESRTNIRRPAWARRLLARWERSLTRRSTALVTVNDALAVELGRRLGPRRTVVVHNAPPVWLPPAVPDQRLRLAAGIPEVATIVLYHGGFQAHRGLAETARAMIEPGLDLGQGFREWPRFLIRPLVSQGIEDIGDGDDAPH